MKFRHVLLAGAALLAPTAAFAQDAPPAETPPAETPPTDGEIVVTAVAQGTTRLSSSITTSSINAETLVQLAPRTSAELLRNLPGIRVEASGGDGNANISVRGLPVASGGSKFLQLQEDGLPIVEFGDITFGNADIFLRTDFNVRTIESVRGGSASTFASNSPGGVINFLSKTGEREGGSFQLSSGIDYREFRTDFDYGGTLADDLTFHLGGFYRIGDGQRAVGYDGVSGGQIKANVTKRFASGGYVRLYGKYLDDRAIGYLPNPVAVSGSDGDPTYRSIANFSINNGTLHSGTIQRAVTLDGDNRLVSRSIRDGQHPVVIAGGFETEIPVADGWSVVERFRYSDISGGFTSPFPSSVDGAQGVATAIAAPARSCSTRAARRPGSGSPTPRRSTATGCSPMSCCSTST